jgi:signal peptidase I
VTQAYVMMGLGVAGMLLIAGVLLKRGLRLSGAVVWVYLGAFTLAYAAVTVATLLLVRPFLLEAFVVPSAGMMPSIHAGDRFVVNKLLTPRRWDIVTFEAPGQPGVRYIKRIVALPGESLTIQNGAIWINGQQQTPPVDLAGVAFHARRVPTYSPVIEESVPYVVPMDAVFVLGDQPDNSLDSRHFGPIPTASIVGVATWTYWPAEHWRWLR